MSRKTRTSLSNDLRQLERQLAALTIQVSAIRAQIATEGNNPDSDNDCNEQTTPAVGQQVRFRIRGRGYVTGHIVRVTEHRVIILYEGSEVIRAPHNVVVID
jgi:hypothetical protein